MLSEREGGTFAIGRDWYSSRQHFLRHKFREQGLDQPSRVKPGRLFFCALRLPQPVPILELNLCGEAMSDSRTETEPAEPTLAASPERAFNVPGVVMTIAALLIAIHVVRVYLLTPDQDIDLILRAAFIPIRYTGGYALDVYSFTSPITYGLLHGGFEHLIVNLIWLVAFGSPLAQRLGSIRFVLFALISSLAAVLLHFVLHASEAVPLIGASGAVAGMMGAATRFAFRIDRSGGMPGFTGPILPIAVVLRQRGVVIFLLLWMVVNLVTGLYSLTPGGGGIAWEAHVGGFVLGFFGIALFDRPGAGRSNLEIDDDTAHDTPAPDTTLDETEDGRGRNSR